MTSTQTSAAKPPNTWMRSFRCNSDLWGQAKVKAASEGRTLGSVIRDLLSGYVAGTK